MSLSRYDCNHCKDTGRIEQSGSDDLPCNCPRGAKVRFNVLGVEGEVTGAEVLRHFLNSSPEPIVLDARHPIHATSLPGRSSRVA
jgi:hypothetical protein